MRQLFFALAFVVTACASPHARADEDETVRDYSHLVQTCVTAARTDDALAACKGAASGPCIERDGGATQMMVFCYSYEADAWEGVIERTAADLAVTYPESATTITEAQHYWALSREQDCAFSQQRWGPGSGAQVDYMRCMAERGADRGLYLLLIQRHPD